MSNGQVDELTGRRGNKLYARRDRVTDEQVRGVTERGEWVADRRGVGWGLKVCGLRTEGEWDGGWDGCGLGEEGKWVGEWKACEGEEYFILM